jgi:hypothetical protein
MFGVKRNFWGEEENCNLKVFGFLAPAVPHVSSKIILKGPKLQRSVML